MKATVLPIIALPARRVVGCVCGLVFALVMHSCVFSKAPATFPDTDIVFQIETLMTGAPDDTVGFVNADGSDISSIALRTSTIHNTNNGIPSYPTGIPGSQTIVSVAPDYISHPAYLVLSQPNSPPKVCSELYLIGPISLTSDYKSIVVAVQDRKVTQIGVFDLERCKEEGENYSPTMLSVPENYKVCYTGGVAYAPESQKIVFGECSEQVYANPSVEQQLIIFDLKTQSGITIGQGLSPAWSPDDSQIAYRGKDGIYIVNADGTDKRKVVDYVNPENGSQREDWPPRPSWSPDGKWLVYHKCTLPAGPKTSCSETNDFAIYKVNIETGEEFKIIDGGLNPHWRGRAEATSK